MYSTYFFQGVTVQNKFTLFWIWACCENAISLATWFQFASCSLGSWELIRLMGFSLAIGISCLTRKSWGLVDFKKRRKKQLNSQFFNANQAGLAAHSWKKLQVLVISAENSSLSSKQWLKRRSVLLSPCSHWSVLCFQQSGSSALEWVGRDR